MPIVVPLGNNLFRSCEPRSRANFSNNFQTEVPTFLGRYQVAEISGVFVAKKKKLRNRNVQNSSKSWDQGSSVFSKRQAGSSFTSNKLEFERWYNNWDGGS